MNDEQIVREALTAEVHPDDIPLEALDALDRILHREQEARKELEGNDMGNKGLRRYYAEAQELASIWKQEADKFRSREQELREALGDIVNASRDEGLPAMVNWMRDRAAAALDDRILHREQKRCPTCEKTADQLNWGMSEHLRVKLCHDSFHTQEGEEG